MYVKLFRNGRFGNLKIWEERKHCVTQGRPLKGLMHLFIKKAICRIQCKMSFNNKETTTTAATMIAIISLYYQMYFNVICF